MKKTLFAFISELTNLSHPVQLQEQKLYKLGFYVMPIKGRVVDLSQYFVDESGDLYTQNKRTHFTTYGMVLKPCSNFSYKGSLLVNTLRDTLGTKVTIPRKKLQDMIKSGELELVSTGAIIKIA